VAAGAGAAETAPTGCDDLDPRPKTRPPPPPPRPRPPGSNGQDGEIKGEGRGVSRSPHISSKGNASIQHLTLCLWLTGGRLVASPVQLASDLDLDPTLTLRPSRRVGCLTCRRRHTRPDPHYGRFTPLLLLLLLLRAERSETAAAAGC